MKVGRGRKRGDEGGREGERGWREGGGIEEGRQKEEVKGVWKKRINNCNPKVRASLTSHIFPPSSTRCIA
jgi:hypothetical protein